MNGDSLRLARLAITVVATAGAVLGCYAGGPPTTTDERMIPASLPPHKRMALSKFLAGLEKPQQFFPAQSKIVSLPSAAPFAVDPPPLDTGAPVKEYLAQILLPPATDRQKGPDQAEVYWFRPNPMRGAVGITVKRVVDLNTGQPVGAPVVLLNYLAPLTRQEKEQATALAREKVERVQRLYAEGKDADVMVAALLDQITAQGVPAGNPGDRVVNLQFRRKRSPQVVHVDVNVTQETIREQN